MNFLPPQICYLLFGFKLPFYFQYFLLIFILYKPLTVLIQNRNLRFFVIFLAPSVILVNLLRNGFFFQSDDFAHLDMSARYSFGEIFRQAMGQQGIWGFHHIFIGFWLFKIIFMFFGVKFEAYLLTNFLLHLVNLSLFYLILNKIKKSQAFSTLVTLLFGTFYLSWISAIHELITATFFLLGTFLWLKWLIRPKKSYLYLFSVSYLLAVCSKEFTFILPIIVFLISIFWHNFVSKVNFKKILLTLRPFFLFMVIYFSIYGKVYLSFFGLEGDGYKASFAFSAYLNNLLVYLTKVIPILNSSIPTFLIFLLIITSFDLWKSKLVLLPLFFSYLILIAPAAFFEEKIALYYAYIPSIFLYSLFFVFLSEIYSSLSEIFKKRKLMLRVFNIYFLLIIALGIFRLDKFFMDNCFLIHYPWENPHRIALNDITIKINRLFSQGEIKEGREIKLEEKEETHEMRYLFNTDALYLFLKDKNARDYSFVYNEEGNSLIVKSRNEKI